MKEIVVSAPGKSILHGEHAVVYGKGAIAVSLGLRTTVILQSENVKELEISFPSLNFKTKWMLPTISNSVYDPDSTLLDIIPVSDAYLKEIADMFKIETNSTSSISQANTTFLYLYSAITQKYGTSGAIGAKISVTSELPIGAGLGSSASYAVCLATALLCLYSQVHISSRISDNELALINGWAFQAEHILHGKPSGIDNSICTYGGALFFQKGQVCDKLSVLPEIKILLINTKEPRNTKQLVGRVKEKMELYASVMEPILQSFEAISVNQWTLLKDVSQNGFQEKELLVLKDMVNMNQHLLNCIGVGHPKLDLICQTASQLDLPAKLTGAGGGGCALIFLQRDSNVEDISHAFIDKGFQVLTATLAGNGVLFH